MICFYFARFVKTYVEITYPRFLLQTALLEYRVKRRKNIRRNRLNLRSRNLGLLWSRPLWTGALYSAVQSARWRTQRRNSWRCISSSIRSRGGSFVGSVVLGKHSFLSLTYILANSLPPIISILIFSSSPEWNYVLSSLFDHFLSSLKRKEHLERHKLGHNPERPFVCDVCRKGFKRREHLNLHTVIHSGVKTEMCTECGKGR